MTGSARAGELFVVSTAIDALTPNMTKEDMQTALYNFCRGVNIDAAVSHIDQLAPGVCHGLSEAERPKRARQALEEIVSPRSAVLLRLAPAFDAALPACNGRAKGKRPAALGDEIEYPDAKAVLRRSMK
jgi:hypothetical protein